ncbi:SDR family NAD(P)-dependent oxidoreductase, partial [Thauera sp. 27]|uniref:SDR family NAD(P)-dependent oxidoreductase n=1 Tax=Thauera sp. 27 TaxID=305700 RepID=UPI002FC398F8
MARRGAFPTLGQEVDETRARRSSARVKQVRRSRRAASVRRDDMAARMQGKVAFVTGGGSGIGAATASRLAQEGATVVVCGRRREPLDEVVAGIVAAGGK